MSGYTRGVAEVSDGPASGDVPFDVPNGVLLQHMPREVALELDRLYGLVVTGYLGVHKNDGEWVKFDHRVTEGRDRFQKRTKAGAKGPSPVR